MSWSAKIAGKPAEVLAQFADQAKASWGYTHSEGDKTTIDWVIKEFQERLVYIAGNNVPTTYVELSASGHWDDAVGQGNVTTSLLVFNDRRKPKA